MPTQSIAAEFEIRSLVHRYADAASRRDATGVASTFAADGEWHAAEWGSHRGRDAMVVFFTTMLDGWNAFLQGLLSGVVVVEEAHPDRATGRWFVHEIGQRSDGTNFSVAGVYHDEYLRGAGAWRIKYRRYDPLLRSADGAATALPFPVDVLPIE